MRMYVKIFYIYIYIVLYSFCNKKTIIAPLEHVAFNISFVFRFKLVIELNSM